MPWHSIVFNFSFVSLIWAPEELYSKEAPILFPFLLQQLEPLITALRICSEKEGTTLRCVFSPLQIQAKACQGGFAIAWNYRPWFPACFWMCLYLECSFLLFTCLMKSGWLRLSSHLSLCNLPDHTGVGPFLRCAPCTYFCPRTYCLHCNHIFMAVYHVGLWMWTLQSDFLGSCFDNIPSLTGCMYDLISIVGVIILSDCGIVRLTWDRLFKPL